MKCFRSANTKSGNYATVKPLTRLYTRLILYVRGYKKSREEASITDLSFFRRILMEPTANLEQTVKALRFVKQRIELVSSGSSNVILRNGVLASTRLYYCFVKLKLIKAYYITSVIRGCRRIDGTIKVF